MRFLENVKNWLWRVFTDHPYERTDSEGEIYVRVMPRSMFLGLINLRPVCYVNKRKREANRVILPAGYDPRLAYQLYQEEGVPYVEAYGDKLRGPGPSEPSDTTCG